MEFATSETASRYMIEFWRRTHYHLIPTVLLDFLLVFDILDNIFAISYVLLQLLKSTSDKKEIRKAIKSNFMSPFILTFESTGLTKSLIYLGEMAMDF